MDLEKIVRRMNVKWIKEFHPEWMEEYRSRYGTGTDTDDTNSNSDNADKKTERKR